MHAARSKQEKKRKGKPVWQVARTQTGYAVGILCGSLFLATLSPEQPPASRLPNPCFHLKKLQM